MCNSIFDIKHTKGETFDSQHIRITSYAFMYISEEFAKWIIDRESPTRYNITNHSITYNGMYKLSIYIRVLHGDTKHKYLVAGSSGSHGFGGLEYTKREELGVRVRRKVNKKIIEIYLSSPFSRKEKLEKLKSQIKTKL